MKKNLMDEVNRVYDFIVDVCVANRRWEEKRERIIDDFQGIVDSLVQLNAIKPPPCKSKWDRFEQLQMEE